jgi:hypothetical protein
MASSGVATSRPGDSKATARSSEAELLCAGLVFFGALFLYAWTLAPTVTLVDSGELIVVARSLGVAHPPGFPLWVMLAHLASLVPFGSVALRINFSSALFGALAAAVLTLVVAELMMIAFYARISQRRLGKKPARRGTNLPDTKGVAIGEEERNRFLLVLAPALAAGMLMAVSRTLWGYSTVTEVYSLNTLIILIIFFLMFRWRRCIISDGRRTAANAARHAPPITDYDSFLYAAALAFGLALGVHHVTVALTLPALAGIVWRTEGLRFFKSKRLVYAAIISLAGLLAVYAFLPLAAARAPVINWGNPRSLEAIWWHITGRQYQSYFSFAPNMMAEEFATFVRMVLREFGPSWLPLGLGLALAGFCSAFKRDRTTFWFLFFVVGANFVYGLGYSIAEDKDAYCLPAFAALAIAAGLGVRWLIQFILSRGLQVGRPHLVAALLLAVVPLTAFAGNWPFNNRRHYFIAQDYTNNILDAIEPNGLLLTFDWQVAAPMLYAQEVEKRRPDVKVVDIHLLRRSWYFDYLRRAWPGLIERSRVKVDAFVIELKQWENDPGAYTNDQMLTQRIVSRFEEMIQSFVLQENNVAPVYLTHDFLTPLDRDRQVSEWVTKNYQLIPEGLVFKLAGALTSQASPEVRLETRGLNDGTLRFEKDDVVRIKVLPAYTAMLVNQGRYHASLNRHARAMSVYQQALALDPGLETARQGIAESASKLQKP